MNKMFERAQLDISRAEVILKNGIKTPENLKIFLTHLIYAVEHTIESEADEQEVYFDKHLVAEGYIEEDIFELYYHLKMLITMDFVISEEGFKAKTWKSSYIIDRELLEEYFMKVKNFMAQASETEFSVLHTQY